ncbi:MAG: hypothetical protein ACAF41_04660 [Leptolyngbya sp. BL-A-14]
MGVGSWELGIGSGQDIKAQCSIAQGAMVVKGFDLKERSRLSVGCDRPTILMAHPDATGLPATTKDCSECIAASVVAIARYENMFIIIALPDFDGVWLAAVIRWAEIDLKF